MENSYQEFISRLKKLYGAFDETNKKFEKAPNSEISRDLGYSDAQFSRLINESATDGEYARANLNAQRILTLLNLEAQLKNAPPVQSKKKRIFSGIAIALIGLVAGYGIGDFKKPLAQPNQGRYDMLRWSFETDYINSYSKLNDLPDHCDFPCYKYQGKWELANAYKLPFFLERSGFHYAATEVHMYARCLPEESVSGKILEGYEYQKHEIWYDIRELSIDSFLVKNGNELHESYKQLDFNKDPNFVKLAYVHTFFVNEFTIDTIEVERIGKVVGRDIEFVDADLLRDKLKSSELATKVLKEVNEIIKKRLEDFSRPVLCGPAKVPTKDFHEIINGNRMSYDCQLTTSRVSINYTKSYELVDQYVKNKCRPL
jgi:hypothetical protein